MLPVLFLFMALTWFTPFLPPQEPPGYTFGQLWKVAVWSTLSWLALLALLLAIDAKAGRKPHWFVLEIEGRACVFFLPVLALQGLLVAQMAAFWSDAPILHLYRDATAWLAEVALTYSGGFANLLEVNDRIIFPQYREMSAGLQAILYIFAPLAFLVSSSIWLKPSLRRVEQIRPFSRTEVIVIVLSFLVFMKFMDLIAASTDKYPWIAIPFAIHWTIYYLFTVPHYVSIFDFMARSIFDIYFRYLVVGLVYFFVLWLLLIPAAIRRKAAAKVATQEPSSTPPGSITSD